MSGANERIVAGDSWSIVTLDTDRGRDLQDLFERSADYFQTVFGLPVGPAEAQSAFLALPEHKTYDDKFLLGIIDDQDVLVGHLDLIRDHPDDGVWTIGVFLLAPDVRGSGLGTEILERTAQWAATRGARTLRIDVVDWNERGLRFLERAGFRRAEAIDGYTSGALEGQLVILERPL